jgi:hypothetical protein
MPIAEFIQYRASSALNAGKTKKTWAEIFLDKSKFLAKIGVWRPVNGRTTTL